MQKNLLQIRFVYVIILSVICNVEVLSVNAVEIILGIAVILVSLVIIAVVLLQQGHRAGINGAISGGADTFLSKNKARTADARLSRMTKYIAILFFVLAIVANVIALRG